MVIVAAEIGYFSRTTSARNAASDVLLFGALCVLCLATCQAGTAPPLCGRRWNPHGTLPVHAHCARRVTLRLVALRFDGAIFHGVPSVLASHRCWQSRSLRARFAFSLSRRDSHAAISLRSCSGLSSIAQSEFMALTQKREGEKYDLPHNSPSRRRIAYETNAICNAMEGDLYKHRLPNETCYLVM